MLSIQDKLSKASLSASKKLMDNSIDLLGTEVNAYRIYSTEDRYHDETIEVIDNSKLTVFIDIPNDFPFNRYRADDKRTAVTTEGLSLFEILPMEMMVKWSRKDSEDKAKSELITGDLLLYIVEDEDTLIPMLFRIAETLGSFNKNLSYLKYAIAPYNGIIEDDLQILINNYISSYTIEKVVED